MISTYIPIFGRTEQTRNLILNLATAYIDTAFLDIIIIDCKGDFSLGKIPDLLSEYDISLQVVRGKSTDYWGACLNIAIDHFRTSQNQYFFICNNDTYHFQENAAAMVSALVHNGCVVSSVGNVKHEDKEVIYKTKPKLNSALSEYVVNLDTGAFFDSNNLSFSASSTCIPNVAPTVSIALSRKLIDEAGASLRVPGTIPHYLSDYYFTHELYKLGASLSSEAQWIVLRFENEASEIACNSLFNIKSTIYIWAWITFFLRNVDPGRRFSVAKWTFYVLKTYSRSRLRSFFVGLGLYRLRN
jgi:hypothetical protein